MSIKNKLVKIVGEKGVIDDPAKMKAYASGNNLDPSRVPNYVARVKSAQEVQKIIQLANKEGIPVIPCSSGIHFNGAASICSTEDANNAFIFVLVSIHVILLLI